MLFIECCRLLSCLIERDCQLFDLFCVTKSVRLQPKTHFPSLYAVKALQYLYTCVALLIATKQTCNENVIVLYLPLDDVLYCRVYKHNKAGPSKQPIVFLSAMFCGKSRSMTRHLDMLQNLTWRWTAVPWCRPPCGTTARLWLSTVIRTHAALHRVPQSSAGGRSTWARTITWGQWHSLSTRVSRNT